MRNSAPASTPDGVEAAKADRYATVIPVVPARRASRRTINFFYGPHSLSSAGILDCLHGDALQRGCRCGSPSPSSLTWSSGNSDATRRRVGPDTELDRPETARRIPRLPPLERYNTRSTPGSEVHIRQKLLCLVRAVGRKDMRAKQ
jgi:hypothetical protein